MAENKNIEQEQVQHDNRLTFDQKVLEKIANYAVQDIDGILELKGNWTNSVLDFFSSDDSSNDRAGVTAEVGEKEVALDLEVLAEYDKSIPDAFDRVISRVSEQVKEMTGLKVVEVNMNVADIMTRKEYDRQKNEEERKAREQRQQEQKEVREQNRSGQYSDGSRVQ